MSAAVIKEIAGCLQRKQSDRLAQILSASFDVTVNETDVALTGQCQAAFTGGLQAFAKVVAALFKSKRHAQNGRFQQAYDEHIAGYTDFLDIYREETNWIMPVLHTLVYDARMLAQKADLEISAERGNPVQDTLRNAEQNIKRAFSMSSNDRASPELSKKPGTLYVVNQLFKIYFQLNTIPLCRNLIRAIDLMDFNRFEKRDQVTYMFYVGRINMFEDNYSKAETCLMYAWQHCHKQYSRNKRMILQFLVPIKLSSGTMPSPQLLDDYALDEYKGIAESIRVGNVYLFNQSMAQYQDKFIQRGVYLLMEKLKPFVMRNLFKKVYLVRDKHNHVKLRDLQNAIAYLNMSEIDMDALECLLANLIFKNYIKGYISHRLKVLVLSKVTPFPPITDVKN
ncbi:hypothetical protein SPRG_15096 [Saprolegnia parasitica CBS 223.65]|uniref:PCI domain-containing protein n=1 Tax=Saprolegnia parasitica (strain CBS 223.65) TaxID=695850 RepID=A0A067BYY0_SAPPC|nr:hypothetical protein SPRG_15096 [Saprolegnia parasitica CBS 223.65]KDO19762.1 hypothetical protein SPRG_15096 [Saprolegnia parasitica CBS 223.65]|eukprot:XP_012209524.1 hypothetical protein SPRG_15096 [Saprolegnia parasitica CBS 223.65]